MTVDSSWITVGVEVIAHRAGQPMVPPTVYRTKVLTVAAKSCTVEGVPERITLGDLRSKRVGDAWNGYWWEILRPDSERAVELLARKRLAELESAACAAVEWSRLRHMMLAEVRDGNVGGGSGQWGFSVLRKMTRGMARACDWAWDRYLISFGREAGQVRLSDSGRALLSDWNAKHGEPK